MTFLDCLSNLGSDTLLSGSGNSVNVVSAQAEIHPKIECNVKSEMVPHLRGDDKN